MLNLTLIGLDTMGTARYNARPITRYPVLGTPRGYPVHSVRPFPVSCSVRRTRASLASNVSWLRLRARHLPRHCPAPCRGRGEGAYPLGGSGAGRWYGMSPVMILESLSSSPCRAPLHGVWEREGPGERDARRGRGGAPLQGPCKICVRLAGRVAQRRGAV